MKALSYQAQGLRAALKISKDKVRTENDLLASDHAPIKKRKGPDRKGERSTTADAISQFLLGNHRSIRSSELSQSLGKFDSGLQKLAERRRSLTSNLLAALLRAKCRKCTMLGGMLVRRSCRASWQAGCTVRRTVMSMLSASRGHRFDTYARQAMAEWGCVKRSCWLLRQIGSPTVQGIRHSARASKTSGHSLHDLRR